MNFRRTQLTISRWFLLKIGKQRRRRGIVGRRCVRSRHRFRLHRGRLLSAIVDCHRPPHAGQTCDRQAELSAERFVGRDNEADSADTCNARPYKETRFPINLAQWPPVLVHQFRTLIRNVAILKPDAYCRLPISNMADRSRADSYVQHRRFIYIFVPAVPRVIALRGSRFTHECFHSGHETGVFSASISPRENCATMISLWLINPFLPFFFIYDMTNWSHRFQLSISICVEITCREYASKRECDS